MKFNINQIRLFNQTFAANNFQSILQSIYLLFHHTIHHSKVSKPNLNHNLILIIISPNHPTIPTPTMSPKIAIIGAGPSGLLLARLLHLFSIPVAVFEGETSPYIRSQGGSLDLHPASGQLALKEAGLYPQFQEHARYEGEDLILCDKNGKKHIQIIGTDRGRPEIDRVVLRGMLIDSLPAETIIWGKRVKNVEMGKIEFKDGSFEGGFDLIVGADGARSKVRHLLTHIPPFYSGVSGFDIRLADVKAHPEIDRMVGHGSLFAFGEEDRKVLLTQRNGDGSLRTYAVSSQPEGWIKDAKIAGGTIEEIREMLVREFAGWSPELIRVIRDFDVEKGDSITQRSLYMLPVGLTWPSQPGITVIGDAAHLMTPFAGEGVNMALADGLSLAREIIKSPNDLAKAVQRYEKEMFPRSTRMTQKSWEGLMSRFAPGAIQAFKDKVRRQVDGLPEDHDMRKKVMVAGDEDLVVEVDGLKIDAVE